jgi:hypothetical protein
MFTSSLIRLLATTSTLSTLTVAAPTAIQETIWQVRSLEIDEDHWEPTSKEALRFELQRPDSFDSCKVEWTNDTVPIEWQKCGSQNDLSYKIDVYAQVGGQTTLGINLQERSVPYANSSQ